MYAQLGDIVFEGLKGLNSIGLKSEQIIAEHQLIEGKPRLQNAGSKADELSLSININSQFANPESEYAALKEYQKTATVLTLINGRGELMGEYVIKTMELAVNKTNGQGQWVDIDIDLSLIEDYNTDKQKQAEIDAKKGGFAYVEKLPSKTALIPIESDAASIMQSVTKVSSDAKTASNFVDKAKQYADKANGYMDQASAKVQEAKNGISEIQQKITNSLTIGSSATNLLNQLTSINSAAGSLITSLNLHDIQTSLGLNSLFQAQMNQMSINSAALTNLIATQS